MSWGGYDGLVNNLPLVRGRQATLPSQIAKLFVSGRHGGDCKLDENDYNPRIIHEQRSIGRRAAQPRADRRDEAEILGPRQARR